MIPKMNPEVKEKWVEALRSGRYEQGRGQLILERKDKSREYCCLGVLADIIAPERITTRDKSRTGALMVDGAFAVLSTEICQKVGLEYDLQDTLANYNDQRKKSFNWIAAYIERYL